jgi:hypothetical protein
MRVRGGIEGQSLKHPTHKSRDHIPHPMASNNHRKEKRKAVQWMDEKQLMAA